MYHQTILCPSRLTDLSHLVHEELKSVPSGRYNSTNFAIFFLCLTMKFYFLHIKNLAVE